MLVPDPTIDASKIVELMLSPALMITACGLLLISTNSRYLTAVFLGGMLTGFVGAVFGVLESRKGYDIVRQEMKEDE